MILRYYIPGEFNQVLFFFLVKKGRKSLRKPAKKFDLFDNFRDGNLHPVTTCFFFVFV